MHSTPHLNPFDYFGHLNNLSITDDHFPPLHLAISRNSENTIELIDQESLDETDSKFGFTPLHLAILCKRVKAIEAIIKKSEEISVNLISKKDLQGWTPLHFNAALSDPQINKILKNVSSFLEVEKSIKNHLGATARIFSQSQNLSDESQLFFQIEHPNKEIQKLPYAYFKQIVGADFSNQVLLNDSALLSLWSQSPKKPSKPEALLYENVKINYPYYKENPLSSIYLTRIDPTIGWGLRAAKKIPKGSIIWEYSGKGVSQIEFQSTPYHEEKIKYTVQFSTFVIDGTHVRNLSAMTNCGFPNAHPHFDFLEDGLPHYVAIALEDIDVEKEVCLDYGTYPCKFQGYQELRQEALDHFLSNDLEGKWNQLVEMHARKMQIEQLDEWIDFLNLQAKIKYLLQTPKVLYDALFKENLSLSQMLKQMDTDLMPTVLDFSEGAATIIYLQNICLSIEKILKFEEKKFKELFLEILDHHPTQVFDFLIVWLSNHSEYEFERFQTIAIAACQRLPNLYDSLMNYLTNPLEFNSDTLKIIQETIENLPVEIQQEVIENILSQVKDIELPHCQINQNFSKNEEK